MLMEAADTPASQAMVLPPVASWRSMTAHSVPLVGDTIVVGPVSVISWDVIPLPLGGGDPAPAATDGDTGEGVSACHPEAARKYGLPWKVTPSPIRTVGLSSPGRLRTDGKFAGWVLPAAPFSPTRVSGAAPPAPSCIRD